MTEYAKQSTEYLIRELARRILPMSLEATGEVDCIAHAKMLRNLAPDASMTDVGRTCQAAAYSADYARASSVAYYAHRASNAAYYASNAANAAYFVANARAAAYAAAAYDAAADAASAGYASKEEYDDIVAEARALAN